MCAPVLRVGSLTASHAVRRKSGICTDSRCPIAVRTSSMPVRIFKHYVHLPILLVALVEALIFYASVYAGTYIRLLGEIDAFEAGWGPIMPRATIFTVVMGMSLVSMGLYQARQRARLSGILVRIAIGFGLGGFVLAALFYLFPGLLLWRGVLLIAAALAFSLVCLVRVVFSALVNENIFKRRVLVFGAGKRAASITQLRRRADQRGFRIVGFIHADGDQDVVDPASVITLDVPLMTHARRHDVDEIVVAMDDRRRSFPVEDLLSSKLAGIEVIDLLGFLERETGKVSIGLMNPSWMSFSEGFTRNTYSLIVSRLIDIVVSLLLLLLTWPIMLVVALLILLEDGAPVLYRQQRVGYDEQPFSLLKFRSMRVDAEAAGEARWAEQNDSRATRIGSVIRKFRIDELPQIINVLRGDMSLVGPRPERPEFVKDLVERIPYYRERHCVKPGITGWAQLCYPYGSSEDDALEKLQYDLYYVKNHDLIFDFMILLQTAEVILWRKGSR